MFRVVVLLKGHPAPLSPVFCISLLVQYSAPCRPCLLKMMCCSATYLCTYLHSQQLRKQWETPHFWRHRYTSNTLVSVPFIMVQKQDVLDLMSDFKQHCHPLTHASNRQIP